MILLFSLILPQRGLISEGQLKHWSKFFWKVQDQYTDKGTMSRWGFVIEK